MADLQRQMKTPGALIITLALAACGQTPSPTSPHNLPSVRQQALSSALGLATPAPAQYEESKIIGIRPLVPVRADGSNVPPTLRKTLDAFGIIAIGGAGSCSGTHLGNGYVLTAGHCFLQNSEAPLLTHQACPTVKIHWGYRGSPVTGNPKPVTTGTSHCLKLIHAELTAERDFALIQVDNPPSAAIGIAAESDRTRDNTKITIFGYPMGRPLEWSQFCATKKSTTVMDSTLAIASRVAYQCDTEYGNSGSSVIAVNSSGVAKVVAVHAAAAPDPFPYNVGTYMFDIRQTLARNGFNLDRALGTGGNRP
jgi:V8-like Glu-specific endopeptidase